MERRELLFGLTGLLVAPAIIRSGSLMRVSTQHQALAVPEEKLILVRNAKGLVTHRFSMLVTPDDNGGYNIKFNKEAADQQEQDSRLIATGINAGHFHIDPIDRGQIAACDGVYSGSGIVDRHGIGRLILRTLPSFLDKGYLFPDQEKSLASLGHNLDVPHIGDDRDVEHRTPHEAEEQTRLGVHPPS